MVTTPPDEFDLAFPEGQEDFGMELDGAPPDVGFEAFSSSAPPAGGASGNQPGSRDGRWDFKGGERGGRKRQGRDSVPQYMEQLSQRRNHAPPQSIEAEQAVLGCLMLVANEGFDKVSEEVTENDFYQLNHRLIFRAIAALATEGRNPDVVTVSGYLEQFGLMEDAGGLNYIGALVEVTPSAGNIKAYAEIVRERSVLRQLIAVANEIADSAYDAEGRTSKDLLDEAETRVFAIADQTSKNAGGFHDIKAVLAGAVERINYLFESDASITGISTGFKELDEQTSGLQKSDLIIIAGRPSMGKTTFAMNLAENAAMTGE